MSSFFTVPALQRKRKLIDEKNTSSSKKRNTNFSISSKPQKAAPAARVKRDESISGSESEGNTQPRRASGGDDSHFSSESDIEDETGAERRLRLAERYLENLKGEVDEIGFDAEEIDRDLIAERLKDDVAESKGRLYRHIASDLAFDAASKTHFRSDTLTTTSIATCPPYVFTVSKDLTFIKWELMTPATHPPPSKSKKFKKPPRPIPCRPRQIVFTKGNKNKTNDLTYNHHTGPILAVAVSSSGRFVATGGADKRLIIWSASDLKPLRVFTQHRDAVTGLAFRRGTEQLYSSSKDRTIKTWSLNELAYVETLFGHQDEVSDVAALSQERCISVGARDRTARLWKVAEETQLVFRGGGGGGEKSKKLPIAKAGELQMSKATHMEGSIDRVAMVDEEMFITGSDNGGISLWTLQKKKPLFTIPLAHGLDPPLTPEEASAEEIPDPKVPGPPLPRWITALATVPYSDLIVSGSWDGWIRVWKISGDKRRIESLGVVGRIENAYGAVGDGEVGIGDEEDSVRGVVNGISAFQRGERGKDGLCIVVAVGKEHRLGRWKTFRGKNGAVVFEVPKKTLESSEAGVGKSANLDE